MTNDKTDRIINRILEVDNFQNMACCCDDFSEFVTEILEWGVDHIAGVDFSILTNHSEILHSIQS